MMSKLSSVFLTGLLGLTLVSCGGSNGGSSSKDEARETAEEVALKVKLMGKVWSSNCRNDDLLNVSVREEYFFESDVYERRLRMFEDTDCKKGAGTITIAGDYQINFQDEGLKEADLDLIAKRLIVSVENEAAVRVLDSLGFCGHDQWIAGEDVVLDSVSGERCLYKELPDKSFGRIEVDGEQKVLYISNTFSSSEDQRPESVDQGMSFRVED